MPVLKKRNGGELGHLNTFPGLDSEAWRLGSRVGAESLRQTKGQLARPVMCRHQCFILALCTKARGREARGLGRHLLVHAPPPSAVMGHVLQVQAEGESHA